jgi:hypothetical protein
VGDDPQYRGDEEEAAQPVDDIHAVESEDIQVGFSGL